MTHATTFNKKTPGSTEVTEQASLLPMLPVGYQAFSATWDQGGWNRVVAVAIAVLETIRNLLVAIPNLVILLINRIHPLLFRQPAEDLSQADQQPITPKNENLLLRCGKKAYQFVTSRPLATALALGGTIAAVGVGPSIAANLLSKMPANPLITDPSNSLSPLTQAAVLAFGILGSALAVKKTFCKSKSDNIQPQVESQSPVVIDSSGSSNTASVEEKAPAKPPTPRVAIPAFSSAEIRLFLNTAYDQRKNLQNCAAAILEALKRAHDSRSNSVGLIKEIYVSLRQYNNHQDILILSQHIEDKNLSLRNSLLLQLAQDLRDTQPKGATKIFEKLAKFLEGNGTNGRNISFATSLIRGYMSESPKKTELLNTLKILERGRLKPANYLRRSPSES